MSSSSSSSSLSVRILPHHTLRSMTTRFLRLRRWLVSPRRRQFPHAQVSEMSSVCFSLKAERRLSFSDVLSLVVALYAIKVCAFPACCHGAAPILSKDDKCQRNRLPIFLRMASCRNFGRFGEWCLPPRPLLLYFPGGDPALFRSTRFVP